MNLKRVFGAVLTVLGIVGLCYGAIVFVNSANASKDIKSFIIYGILGLVFFIAGIKLIRTTSDTI